MNSVTVSFSQMASWKACRQKWAWSYVHDIQPKQYEPHITLGSLCHAGVETYLRGKIISRGIRDAAIKSGKEYFQEELDEINRQVILAQQVLERTLPKLIPARLEEIAVEQPFKLRIPHTRHYVEGRFDAIIEDSYGMWLVEWKFPKSFRSEVDVQLSTQVALYHWAALKCGYPIVGVLYNQILPRLPAIPERTQKGVTSRKEIYTDWETYQATLIERGEDPQLYIEEMKPKLADKEFWRSYRLYRSPEEVEQYVSQLRSVACEIASKRKRIYTCESIANCGSCFYRDLCLETARGRDPQHLIESAYEKRTHDHHTTDNGGMETDSIPA